MAKRERPTGFDNLINTTTEAFAASAVEKTAELSADVPKMVNNRQSVYRVPLSMILPDRFQARFTLPHAIRKAFYAGQINWAEATKRWLKLSKKDRLVRREIEELTFLGESLQDEGQIKPITGQVFTEDGREVFKMLTGERRFWATAIKAVTDGSQEEPYILAIIDNEPTLEKQIAENMAYKALNAVGKARAAARIVLEGNGVSPEPDEDEYAYFRKVFNVRLSEEARQALQEALQLERTYFGRLMKFFDLPEPVLEICDRAEMPERVLREIMQYDKKHWKAGVVYYAGKDGRTYNDVHVYMDRISGKVQSRKPRPPVDPATKSARAVRRAIFSLEDIPQEDKIGALADAMLGDVDRDQARKLLGAISDLQKALSIRVKNMGR